MKDCEPRYQEFSYGENVEVSDLKDAPTPDKVKIRKQPPPEKMQQFPQVFGLLVIYEGHASADLSEPARVRKPERVK